MSKAPRPATWKTRSRTCPGHCSWLGQRRSLSPSFCWARVVPQAGHSVGITHSARPSGRSGSTGPTISGITSPALRSIDGVAGADVLAPDLVGVVERGVLDGGAGDPGGLHDAVRRDPAGAADVDLDREQLGVDLLGGVLEGDRPARRPAGRAQPPLQRDVVDLDHDPVDLVGRDRVAVVPGLLDEALDLLQRRQHLDLVGGRQAPGRQRAVGLGLGRRLEALPLADAVADHAERPGGGDPRVLLAQRPGGGVAGVGEDGLARLGHRDVEPLERLDRQEHLAAHLDQRGDREVVARGQPVRDRVDGLDVGRDVLAGPAVAPGQGTDQATVLVEQVDRQAVHLELAQQGRVRDAVAREPGVPGGELVVGEGVVEALHPAEVVDGGELRRDRAADLLRRRVRRAELGVVLLEGLELAQADVEVGVGEGRRVEDVVAPAGVLDLLAQLAVPLARLVGGRLGVGHGPYLAVSPPTARPTPGALAAWCPSGMLAAPKDHRGGHVARAVADEERRPGDPSGRDRDAARRQGARPGRSWTAGARPGDAARRCSGRSAGGPTRPAPAPGCCATGTAAGTAAPGRSATPAGPSRRYAASSARCRSCCWVTRWAPAPPSTWPTTPRCGRRRPGALVPARRAGLGAGRAAPARRPRPQRQDHVVPRHGGVRRPRAPGGRLGGAAGHGAGRPLHAAPDPDLERRRGDGRPGAARALNRRVQRLASSTVSRTTRASSEPTAAPP